MCTTSIRPANTRQISGPPQGKTFVPSAVVVLRIPPPPLLAAARQRLLCRAAFGPDQWAERFQDLVGPLWSLLGPAHLWVKRQRYQYQLWCQRDVDAQQNTTANNNKNNNNNNKNNNNNNNNNSTMTRLQALEDVGFCWDSQSAAWGERLTELRAAAHGHANQCAERATVRSWPLGSGASGGSTN